MLAQDFCQWLKGYVDLADPVVFTPSQLNQIKSRLKELDDVDTPRTKYTDFCHWLGGALAWQNDLDELPSQKALTLIGKIVEVMGKGDEASNPCSPHPEDVLSHVNEVLAYAKDRGTIKPFDIANGLMSMKDYSVKDITRLFNYLAGEGYGTVVAEKFILFRNKTIHLQQELDYLPANKWVHRKLKKLPRKNKGFIYLIRCEKLDIYKVGMSRTPRSRLAKMQTGLPQSLVLVHVIETEDMATAESYFHNKYSSKRVRGEWFRFSEGEVAEFCNYTKDLLKLEMALLV